jgi:hypothetical protein
MPNEKKQTAQTNTYKTKQANLETMPPTLHSIHKGAIVFSEHQSTAKLTGKGLNA